jgi:hypothetical protein
VPLFIEEVTRLVLEGGAQTIPLTLQQSLAARLDRLGDARDIAQIGAVAGGNSRSGCCSRSQAAPKLNSTQRSSNLSTPISCSSTASRPMRHTASSTR